MEVVHYREHSSQAKVLGTLVSIAGAFVVTFYKGPPIFNTHSSLSSIMLSSSPHSNWVLGAFFCATESFFTSLWYIYQASVMKKYPAVMVTVFFQIFFSAILSGLFALIAVREVRAWVLRLDMGLISVFYQAVVATAIRYSLCTWCVHKAGALFCTLFKPVGIIFTVIMGALFLGDAFHLGSLIGAVTIVVGFYGVMWGKAQEETKFENLESSCPNVPLLQNKV